MKSWLVQFFCCMVLLTSIYAAQDPAPVQPPPANPPILKLDPSKLEFGSMPVGTSSAPHLTTLTNMGKDTLRVIDITASGIDFQETNQCGDSLAAGASCEIRVTFTPAISGSRLGVLSVMVSHPGTPYYVGLTGNGL